MLTVKDGVVKCLHPIRKSCGEGDFKPREKIDINSKMACHILENFAGDNYNSIFEIDNHFIGQSVSFTDIVPDLNVKILNPETEDARNHIEHGKEFFENNKDQMKQQMNVVAFYSIKDSKPFYYVSSAEARLAIEYIGLCRKHKMDIFKENLQTIKTYVEPVSEIIKTFEKDIENNPKVKVWIERLETESQTDDLDELSDVVKIAYKQMFSPMKIGGRDVFYNKIYIEGSIEFDQRLIDIVLQGHESLNVINFPTIQYVVCGRKTYENICKYPSVFDTPKFSNANSHEVEMGISGTYRTACGKKYVVLGNVDENNIIVVSREISLADANKKIYITKYEIEK